MDTQIRTHTIMSWICNTAGFYLTHVICRLKARFCPPEQESGEDEAITGVEKKKGGGIIKEKQGGIVKEKQAGLVKDETLQSFLEKTQNNKEWETTH
jgi:hypothetical protein